MGAFHHANNTVAAMKAVVVTASDTTHLPTTRALYVGGTGDLALVLTDSDLTSASSASDAQAVDVIFYNVSAGTVLPVQVQRVLSTGTTATNIVALY